MGKTAILPSMWMSEKEVGMVVVRIMIKHLYTSPKPNTAIPIQLAEEMYIVNAAPKLNNGACGSEWLISYCFRIK